MHTLVSLYMPVELLQRIHAVIEERRTAFSALKPYSKKEVNALLRTHTIDEVNVLTKERLRQVKQSQKRISVSSILVPMIEKGLGDVQFKVTKTKDPEKFETGFKKLIKATRAKK